MRRAEGVCVGVIFERERAIFAQELGPRGIEERLRTPNLPTRRGRVIDEQIAKGQPDSIENVLGAIADPAKDEDLPTVGTHRDREGGMLIAVSMRGAWAGGEPTVLCFFHVAEA